MFILKGQFNKIFNSIFSFININLVLWPTKLLQFLSLIKFDNPGIKPQGDWLAGWSDAGESCFADLCLIPRVWNPEESDFDINTQLGEL